MTKLKANCAILLASVLFLGGCTGVNSFGVAGRPGDTIVLTTGWNQTLTPENVSLTFTDSIGTIVAIPGTDPTVRTVANMYPDPLSELMVEGEIGDPAAGSGNAAFWAQQIRNGATGGDRDISQSLVMVDIPLTLFPGPATVVVSTPGGDKPPISVEVLEGTGAYNLFFIHENPTPILGAIQFTRRVAHYTVSFQSSIVPYAIQADFTHDPDEANGGQGTAYVVNPRGDLKNVAWSDDGTNLRVLLTPAQGQTFGSMTDFKFYVASGLTGLQLAPNGIIASDIDGNPVFGVNATLVPST